MTLEDNYMAERIDVLILTDHDTFLRGWIDPNFDKEGNPTKIFINHELHPYIKVGEQFTIDRILVPYKMQYTPKKT